MVGQFWKRVLVALMFSWVLTHCGEGSEEGGNEVGAVGPTAHLAQSAFYNSSSVWRSPSIPVCWENPGPYTQELEWVRAAVVDSWVKNSKLSFTGWGTCSSESTGVRISINEDTPHTGKFVERTNGPSKQMVLNFTYLTYGKTCKYSEGTRHACIKRDAVHEFGHAIGLAHEQNRLDTPTCDNGKNDHSGGGLGDYTIGAWDLDSVMNHCNPDWSGNGNLSKTDIIAVRTLYGDMFDYSLNSTQLPTIRTVPLLVGQSLTAGTCDVAGSSGSGDTTLSLYDASGKPGGHYTIRAGCFSTQPCSGTVAYSYR